MSEGFGVPHRPPILALRERVSVDATGAEVLVRVDADSTLLVGGVCPCWAALELVGQAAATFAAAQGGGAGGAGFIVRARAWRFLAATLPVGVDLLVRLRRLDDGVGASGTFEGEVVGPDGALATGRILVQAGG